MPDIFALLRTATQSDNELSGAEVLLPVQFHNRRNSAEPLRRLMVAILVDAIRCVQTRFDAHQAARRQEHADARSWIFSGDDRAVFSFKAICDALDEDPNSLRKYLQHWEDKRRNGEKAQRIIRRAAVPVSKRMSR